MKDNKNSGMLSPEFIQKLKAKNDIVSIISKYMRLEKRGRSYWGCCPFHHEKTPSFSISEYEGFYHCFGCGESGDVISFLRKYEDLSYFEAVRVLAENAGMEMPKFENDEKYIKAKREKERSLQILNLTREFYKQNLYKPNATVAQEYLKKRRLTKSALNDFELGVSLNSVDLPMYLRSKGYTNDEMVKAGVCEISKKGLPYDFIFDRLAFPIVNTQGDCIGFSGRDLENSDMMKYKNTSATKLFDKSKTVYAINLVKKQKQAEGIKNIIIVEGQFDVISMHMAGFKNTVACLGTALTKDHFRELKRFTDNIILCFDGDSAGQKATLRALETFEQNGADFEVKAVRLPNGMDPDEYLKTHGAESLKNLIENAFNPIMFKINNIREKYNLENYEDKAKFTKEALMILAKLNSSTEQEIYLNELKNITGTFLENLKRDLQNLTLSTAQTQKSQDEEKSGSSTAEGFADIASANIKAERFIVASILHRKPYARFDNEIYDALQNPSLKSLYKLLEEKYASNSGDGQPFLVSSVFDYFDVENEPNIKFAIDYNFEIISGAEEYFEECVFLIINENLKFKKTLLSKQYSQVETPEQRQEIIIKLNEINKKLQLNLKLRNKK